MLVVFLLFISSWKGRDTLVMISSTLSSLTERRKRWPPSLPTASNLNSHVYTKWDQFVWWFYNISIHFVLDIFALVTYLPGEDAYRFHIYSEESVPLFGPSLPSPPIFPKVPDFREFLLVKRTSKYDPQIMIDLYLD